MPATLPEAVPYILIAVAILIAFWLILRAMRKTTVVDRDNGDVLDEGAAPAARNQALIDAPPAKAPEPLAEPAPEPVAQPEPAPTATPAPAPAPSSEADDLRKIKGLGPKLVALLKEQGITSFAQIAEWSDEDVARIDATLGRVAGRIEREQWVAQAKLLVTGESSEFSQKFGNDG